VGVAMGEGFGLVVIGEPGVDIGDGFGDVVAIA
jgi:hypothetical protein